MTAIRILVAFWACVSVGVASATITTNCQDNQECLIEIPGSTCADGTNSFITMTRRPGAHHLLVYLNGGGACWSKDSCQKGLASSLTRKEDPSDWNGGDGIQNAGDSANPFAKDFNIISVPYCTGDAFAGSRTADYGGGYTIQHHGFKNVQLAFAKVKQMFPTPQKVVLLGCSAGGIGAYYHLRTLNDAYPTATKYVISDAGTPFRPPYIKAANYKNVMLDWGADQTLPPGVNDFSELVKYNTEKFPSIKFGFLSAYQDKVMTFFALAVGSDSPFSAVKSTIIDLSDKYIGKTTANAKVFYTDSSRHCHTEEPLGQVTSLDTDLGTWMGQMVGDAHGWDNVRPDLTREIIINHNQPLPTLDDVQTRWER